MVAEVTYNTAELVCISSARLLEDGKVVFAGAGLPLLAAILAQKTHAKGLTILFTEHDMGVVFGIARRISVLHQGSMIADGTPEEVRASEEVQKVYLGGAA